MSIKILRSRRGLAMALLRNSLLLLPLQAHDETPATPYPTASGQSNDGIVIQSQPFTFVSDSGIG